MNKQAIIQSKTKFQRSCINMILQSSLSTSEDKYRKVTKLTIDSL